MQYSRPTSSSFDVNMALKQKLCIRLTGLQFSLNGASRRESIILLFMKWKSCMTVHGRTNHFIRLQQRALWHLQNNEELHKSSISTENLTANWTIILCPALVLGIRTLLVQCHCIAWKHISGTQVPCFFYLLWFWKHIHIHPVSN